MSPGRRSPNGNTLTTVYYHGFDSDYQELRWTQATDAHQLDRELVLCFEDRDPLFVSWDSQPVQYAIGFGNKSFFQGEYVRMDVSGWKVWSELFGQEVTLTFIAEENQILEISSLAGAVYLSAYEANRSQWWMDTIYVSNFVPERTVGD